MREIDQDLFFSHMACKKIVDKCITKECEFKISQCCRYIPNNLCPSCTEFAYAFSDIIKSYLVNKGSEYPKDSIFLYLRNITIKDGSYEIHSFLKLVSGFVETYKKEIYAMENDQ